MANSTDYATYTEWKGWNAENFGKFSPLQYAIYSAEVFRHLKLRPSKILEIGFGNGCFLAAARQAGHEAFGIEIIDELKRWAADQGFGQFDDVANLPANAFDAAVAFDVLEHIPQSESIAFLSNISHSLKPHGLIILRVPNGQSPFGMLNQNGDVTHLSVLTEDKIRYLAAMSGLETVSIKGPVLTWRHQPPKWVLAKLIGVPLRYVLETTIAFLYAGKRTPMGTDIVAILRKPA